LNPIESSKSDSVFDSTVTVEKEMPEINGSFDWTTHGAVTPV
jgi:hypothetical protein